ncbi:hypothetical protein H6P81_017143 [Aristolochia fimbriata]|uniref:Uncharacterized protein n=1 Tax=Aristolochia fimbriata TaxID=158543 RepID=A0AAV7DXN8_ARIFI|nr:hypothetical protein H6P81_017143 [Aristolochia fimbriata]
MEPTREWKLEGVPHCHCCSQAAQVPKEADPPSQSIASFFQNQIPPWGFKLAEEKMGASCKAEEREGSIKAGKGSNEGEEEINMGSYPITLHIMERSIFNSLLCWAVKESGGARQSVRCTGFLSVLKKEQT